MLLYRKGRRPETLYTIVFPHLYANANEHLHCRNGADIEQLSRMSTGYPQKPKGHKAALRLVMSLPPIEVASGSSMFIKFLFDAESVSCSNIAQAQHSVTSDPSEWISLTLPLQSPKLAAILPSTPSSRLNSWQPYPPRILHHETREGVGGHLSPRKAFYRYKSKTW